MELLVSLENNVFFIEQFGFRLSEMCVEPLFL